MGVVIKAVLHRFDSKTNKSVKSYLDQDAIPGKVDFEYLENEERIKFSFFDEDIGNKSRINDGHLVFDLKNTKFHKDYSEFLLKVFQEGIVEQAEVEFSFREKDHDLAIYSVNISFVTKEGNTCAISSFHTNMQDIRVNEPYGSFLDQAIINNRWLVS